MADSRQHAAVAREGVFYVAMDLSRFVIEAYESATSLKACLPGVHVTLFTDRPEAAQPYANVFDSIRPLPVVTPFVLQDATGNATPGRNAHPRSALEQALLTTNWASGLLGKVRAFTEAPYEKSLYLDTDTRVLTPRLRELFELLDAYELAIVACEDGESRGQVLLGRRMFNSGVMAFRKTPAVRRLMQAWLELQEAHAEAVRAGDLDRFSYVRHLDRLNKIYQLVADQTALARYLSPDVNEFGVNYLTLSRIWNWRRDEIDQARLGAVVVHHADRFKRTAS
jgi:hypothetical protein